MTVARLGSTSTAILMQPQVAQEVDVLDVDVLEVKCKKI
jgi:hypothetical protein